MYRQLVVLVSVLGFILAALAGLWAYRTWFAAEAIATSMSAGSSPIVAHRIVRTSTGYAVQFDLQNDPAVNYSEVRITACSLDGHSAKLPYVWKPPSPSATTTAVLPILGLSKKSGSVKFDYDADYRSYSSSGGGGESSSGSEPLPP